MILEFLQSNSWTILNGILLGVAFSRIQSLKQHQEWKDRSHESTLEGLKKYEIKFARDYAEDVKHGLDLINQRLTMEVDWLKKELEELKKK